MGKILGCAMVGMEEPGTLCPGLLRLMEEHVPLREQLTALYEAAGSIGGSEAEESLAEQFRQLQERVNAFAEELLIDHFYKEEQVLFPMAERLLEPIEKQQLLYGIQSI